MSGKLAGKAAIVTGAGRGIGRAIALKFAAEGARVVVNDLDGAPAAEVTDEIARGGGEAIACVGDVVAPRFPETLIDACVERFGGLDIIVNNAGYTWDNVIQKMSDEQWRAILEVHLTAPFRVLRAAQPVISAYAKKERENGQAKVRKIVNVSSIAGLFGHPGQSNYAAAKAGVIGLTQTLAKEWGRINTTVNCVAYGLIRTRLAGDVAEKNHVQIGDHSIAIGINSKVLEQMEATIPLGRGGTPEEAAGAAFLFAIPESDYVSGQTLLCSGGLTGF
jgi:3-oxoacyl-[acyl-carrier protein] reductase